MKYAYCLLVYLIILTSLSYSQDSIAYYRGFPFEVGIYVDFKDFKSNNPISFEEVKNKRSGKTMFPNGLTDFKNTIDNTNGFMNPSSIFIYVDGNNDTTTFRSGPIWGYSNGRNIYINSIERGLYGLRGPVYSDSIERKRAPIDFERIGIIGSICHFADIDMPRSSNDHSSRSPNYLSSPGFKGIQKVNQYLIDTKTGAILKLNKESMIEILSKDRELLNSFLKESNNKRGDKLPMIIHQYIKTYNSKHHLKFPEK